MTDLATAGSGAELTRRYTGALMNTFGTPQRVLVRGEGAYVWDADGARHLDLLGGIAVNALGHAHPTLVSAVAAQLGTLGHVSNFFATPTQVTLAERLLEIAQAPDGSRVFFTNSGTEANEAAFKMIRLHGRARGASRVLALEGAFHGRTMGALALTHKAAYREPFEPLPGGVEHVPFDDVAALEAAFAAGVAGLVIEPIQGEAGVRTPVPGYLAAARELATRHDALLVLDEVQTGVGRCGHWLAHHDPEIGGGVVPDVVTLAKGLGGGIPVGAVIAYGQGPGTLFGPGNHGTTFGGNPVAAAAALATIHVIERDALLAHVRDLGAAWRAQLAACHPRVTQVRGHGLLIAIELDAPIAAHVQAAALEAGFIVNAPTPTSLRLAPPLILTAEQAATFTAALPAAIDAGVRAPHAQEQS
ncbi:acetylornithine transaminase [Litorihabitans aurantiacus]|uniref:Acetylornithine aminotransferase n=1 Tax=Litorihabitans aurantiacus TaxID=1930061 RepID=A0AA38CTA8_9MICO|nr:acetylornithine transaminase [Litorihabitans aurantiacus]GMA31662.1 acetylornithine aminotransferase [Litorihabitans aurantiacus]